MDHMARFIARSHRADRSDQTVSILKALTISRSSRPPMAYQQPRWREQSHQMGRHGVKPPKEIDHSLSTKRPLPFWFCAKTTRIQISSLRFNPTCTFNLCHLFYTWKCRIQDGKEGKAKKTLLPRLWAMLGMAWHFAGDSLSPRRQARRPEGIIDAGQSIESDRLQYHQGHGCFNDD